MPNSSGRNIPRKTGDVKTMVYFFIFVGHSTNCSLPKADWSFDQML